MAVRPPTLNWTQSGRRRHKCLSRRPVYCGHAYNNCIRKRIQHRHHQHYCGGQRNQWLFGRWHPRPLNAELSLSCWRGRGWLRQSVHCRSRQSACEESGNQRGIITTVAGNGTNNYSGNGGAATNAEMSYPVGVAVDFGSVVICSLLMNLNQLIQESKEPTASITTVAGDGVNGYSGNRRRSHQRRVSLSYKRLGWTPSATCSLRGFRRRPCSREYSSTELSPPWRATERVLSLAMAVRRPTPDYSLFLVWHRMHLAICRITVDDGGGNNSDSRGCCHSRALQTLRLKNVGFAAAGSYSESDYYKTRRGSVTSSVAVVTVLAPPIITNQPRARRWPAARQPGGFFAGVSGSLPFGFQWVLEWRQFERRDQRKSDRDERSNHLMREAYTVVVTKSSLKWFGLLTSAVAVLQVLSVSVLVNEANTALPTASPFFKSSEIQVTLQATSPLRLHFLHFGWLRLQVPIPRSTHRHSLLLSPNW